MFRYTYFLLLLPIASVSAYEPERAVNNLAHELAECVAYYAISSKLIEPQNPKTAKQLDHAAMLALEGANALTSKKVTEARVEMAAKSMTNDLSNDITNFSIILNKYSDSCGEAINSPEARMNYWLKKHD